MVMNKYRALHWFVFVIQQRKIRKKRVQFVICICTTSTRKPSTHLFEHVKNKLSHDKDI